MKLLDWLRALLDGQLARRCLVVVRVDEAAILQTGGRQMDIDHLRDRLLLAALALRDCPFVMMDQVLGANCIVFRSNRPVVATHAFAGLLQHLAERHVASVWVSERGSPRGWTQTWPRP